MNLTREERDEIAKDVDAFLRDHPKIQQKLTADDLELSVITSIEFRPRKPAIDFSLVDEISTRLVRSDKPWLPEYFDQILALPLTNLDRQYVEFCKKTKNRLVTRREMIDRNFFESRHVSINSLCKRGGLFFGIREGDTTYQGNDWMKRVGFRFYVLVPGKGKKIKKSES